MKSKFAELMKILDEVEASYECFPKVIYSAINKEVFEEYCEKHLECCNEDTKGSYFTETICQYMFRVLWIVTYLSAGETIWSTCIQKYLPQEMVSNMFFLILVALWIWIFEIIGAKILKRLSPKIFRIKQERAFIKKVQDYYYPLFVIQELFEENLVQSVRPFSPLICVQYVDCDGECQETEVF